MGPTKICVSIAEEPNHENPWTDRLRTRRVAVNHIAFGRYARAEEIMLKAITKAEGNAQ